MTSIHAIREARARVQGAAFVPALARSSDPARPPRNTLIAYFYALLLVLLGGFSAPALSAEATPAAPGDTRYIQANGLRFAYIEEGQGPLVLLLHGYPETARSWSGVQHRIAKAGYRVVAPFMRGYPPSEAGKDYSLGTLAQDVVGLIDALGGGPAIVVGHDWGAAAAYSAAAQSPSHVRKLVAIGLPHPYAYVNDLLKGFMEAPHFIYYQLPWAEMLVAANDFAHIERLYKLFAPGYNPPIEVMADIKNTLRVPGATRQALAYYRALLSGGLGALLATGKTTIPTPSLVIAGADDPAARVERYAQARPAFTGPYTFVKLEGVGHFVQLEAPDETAQAILSFLASPD